MRRALVVALATVLVLGASGAAVANGESPPSPGLASATQAIGSDPVAIEDVGLKPDITLTSEQFRPHVSFVLKRLENSLHGEETDWCERFLERTGARTFAFHWLYGCVDELRLIRPYAVECSTADEHPDAAELARAILAKPGMKDIRDMGDLGALAELAPSVDLSAHPGRTLLITRSAPFQRISDPDQCRLLPEPGSGDPTIEIRDDVNSLLVLMDVGGELVVLRVSGGGYDLATGSEAESRGYAVSPADEMATYMLNTIRDLAFEE